MTPQRIHQTGFSPIELIALDSSRLNGSDFCAAPIPLPNGNRTKEAGAVLPTGKLRIRLAIQWHPDDAIALPIRRC